MCPHCTMLAKAEFDPFVWRDATGGTRFANAMSGAVWPVFRREPRGTLPRRRQEIMGTPCGQKVTRSIEKSARVAEVRHWIPTNPLLAHHMRIEDAARASRGLFT
jgi:hypothetical protein